MASIFSVTFLIFVAEITIFKVVGKRLHSDNLWLKQQIETVGELTASLAEELCLDMSIYQEKIFSESSMEKCRKNFMSPHATKIAVPPAIQIQCRLPSSFGYKIATISSKARRLVVLTSDDISLYNLPYDLTDKEADFGTIMVDNTPGVYKSWTAMLLMDGRHSRWRRGPDIATWNATGDVPLRNYSIRIHPTHEVVNGTSKVQVHFSWNSFHDEDVCFHLVNHCDGQPVEMAITPSMNRSRVIPDLPLDTLCQVSVSGRHGKTTLVYHTPKCKDLPDCVEASKVQDLSLVAVEGSQGWNVEASWSPPRVTSLRYNITFFSEHVVRSMVLPRNATSAIFLDVEDNVQYYSVAVGAVHEKATAYTSARAQITKRAEASALGAVLGGSWAALLLLAALLAALLVLWRRRAHDPHPIYFPVMSKQGPFEKADKEAWSDEESAGGSGGADRWELRPGDVVLHEVVGEGAFGVVRRATLKALSKDVAVKMLKDFPTLDEMRSLRAEMELMKSVGAHPHVVSLVGVCSGRRPLIVAEYCARGDLLSYLRCSWDVMMSKRNVKYCNDNVDTSGYRNEIFKCKPKKEHSNTVVNKLYDLQGICDTELTSRNLLSFCRQIAMGMEFLASNRLVHRDLAARNVLVCEDRTLKIADFGLSRDVYEENQYKQKGNGKMPIKWMALESLMHRIYTTQSDVWSFGIVMWEVSSVGASPYAGIAGAKLPRLLRSGYRLPAPASCMPALYSLMLSCWSARPRERPTFTELHQRLDALLQTASADDYLALELDSAPPPVCLKSKLSWTRNKMYERAFWPVKKNHYSSPPASLVRTSVA